MQVGLEQSFNGINIRTTSLVALYDLGSIVWVVLLSDIVGIVDSEDHGRERVRSGDS